MKTNFIEISNKVQKDTKNICRKFYNNAELYVKEINNEKLKEFNLGVKTELIEEVSVDAEWFSKI